MQIGVDGEGGTVEEVGAVYTTLHTGKGRFKIPNAELARKTVLVAGAAQADGPVGAPPPATGQNRRGQSRATAPTPPPADRIED